jgi:hypothetical protein
MQTCGASRGWNTKTNPNIGLRSSSLATPRRDSMDALVDYKKSNNL